MKTQHYTHCLGAVLVGFGTRHFTLSQSRLHSFVAKRMFLGNPLSSNGRKMLTVPNIAAIGTKVAIRAVTGGVMYDVIKRSREEVYRLISNVYFVMH